VIAQLDWSAPYFVVAAISKEGTWPICLKVMEFLEASRRVPEDEAVAARDDAAPSDGDDDSR
jgi:GTP-binding protein